MKITKFIILYDASFFFNSESLGAKCNKTHYYHGYDLLEAVTIDGNEDAETEAIETDEETITEAK